MQREIVLAVAAALGAVGGRWLFLRPVKKPPSISSKARTGYLYGGVSLIGMGLVNLYYGILDGKMFWASKGHGYIGWLFYSGNEYLFAYLGLLYAWAIIFGLCIIKVFVLNSREEK